MRVKVKSVSDYVARTRQINKNDEFDVIATGTSSHIESGQTSRKKFYMVEPLNKKTIVLYEDEVEIIEQ